ncbi:MAG: phosphomannomutase [Candidatus Krumholzibacteria bacterium]|nr:phosphomannomutase [Candidatus Krumholzibacteria bacterium]
MSADRAKPPCFKAYDIRGVVPTELDTDLAYRIGLATARFLGARRMVVGRDCRLSSAELCESVARGLTDAGVDVLDIGLCGTEMVYYTTFARELDGGIMVTASHNPMDHNGMKLVRDESKPISGDSGLDEIGIAALSGDLEPAATRGQVTTENIMAEYVEYLVAQVDVAALKPLKIVANAGNGCAGPAVAALAKYLPCEIIPVFEEPDGTFPNGIPNPLLPENRGVTAETVREHGADLGLAWDGDFDRCFFFDETGAFIEGYYLVGLLATASLRDHPGGGIVHDPRLTWNTIDMVEKAGGRPIMNKTGHAFMKERMRAEDAVYGGEMSAHHYFRQFSYCDSGMLPWLLVVQEMSVTGRPLSDLVKAMQEKYPASGEINRRLKDPDAALDEIEKKYLETAKSVDRTDGLSLDMGQWRFNLRKSNTEPVIRLNVESRGDRALMDEKTAEILDVLDQ